MRRQVRILILLAACVLELSGPAPSLAQAYTYDDAQMVETYWTKKKRRQRKFIIYGVLGLISLAGCVFFGLNAMDRNAARKALRKRQLEREQSGIA
jgi:hypothetical protein